MPLSKPTKYQIQRMREIDRIKKSYVVFDIPLRLRKYIEEAINSESWDFFAKCDGCTLVQERWASGYFPPCVVHDYLRQNKIGDPITQDLVFKDLMEAYKLPKWEIWRNFLGVRLIWFFLKR